MRKVDFFIAGAPKSGTTALSEYLRAHPNVCFSQPKETGYFDEFNKGFKGSEAGYMDYFFPSIGAEHLRVGEGSVWYLYSEKAFENIRAYHPSARIIIMLRNPIEMVQSLHSQLYYNYTEDVKDFRKAWMLQEERSSGSRLPRGCQDPALLQYRQVGMYAKQVRRLWSTFPQEQVLILVFDDFIRDTRAVYQQVLSFLSLEDDGRSNFPKINENKIRKFRCLGKVTLSAGRTLKHKGYLRKMAKATGCHVLTFLDRFNTEKTVRQPIEEAFYEVLVNSFRDDIGELSELIKRDLGCWLKQSGE